MDQGMEEFIDSEDKENIIQNLSDKNISELLDSLKNGVTNLIDSERYKQFLNFTSHLYKYSPNNTLLIAAQKPDATYVGSYSFWKEQNRYVKKGEKAIRIIAPIMKKKKQNITMLGANGLPLLDSNGNIVNGSVNENVVVGYHTVPVFDISQTDGQPVPKLLNTLSGSSEVAEKIIDTITKISEVPISYDNIRENGYYDSELREIVVKESLDNNQKAKTLVHEYTHSILHNRVDDYQQNRDKYEIEAESTAYIVSKHYGLDTSEYSFGYLVGWSAGKSLDEYEESLNLIHKAAKNIILSMDAVLQPENERENEKEKAQIKKELQANNIQPNKHIVDGIFLLNTITNHKNTVSEVKNLVHNISTIENSELKSCISTISKHMVTKDQAVTKTGEYEMER